MTGKERINGEEPLWIEQTPAGVCQAGARKQLQPSFLYGFKDFCELAVLSISNAVDRAQYEGKEARYLQIVKAYKPEEGARLPKMLACLALSMEEGMSDCLGQLFMALELGNSGAGQFFTALSCICPDGENAMHRCWPSMQGAGIRARDGAGGRGRGDGDRHCGGTLR
jgi:hypothetical protein